jgi:Bacterial SH3 domain
MSLELNMPTAELTDARLNRHNSAGIEVDHETRCWDPPVTPTEPSNKVDTLLEEEATPGDDYLFEPGEQSEIRRNLMGFGSQRKLIIGTAVVAALAIGGLAFAFWPAASEKKEVETAEAAPAVQSEPVAPVRAARRRSEPSFVAPTALAWPDLPTAGIVGATPSTAAPAENTKTRQTAPVPQNQDIVFLQRPGVNIRSAPAANGPVLGTALKGTRFKVAKRDGDWVQVESDRLKGWINSQFLGSNEPR